MKKTSLLVMFSIMVASLCVNAYAEDVSSQVQALEQKADRVQSQINLAKQQGEANLDAQVKALSASIDSLMRQRVQLDAHIARLEGQIDELKQNASTSLGRQVKQYEAELGTIKQEIKSLVSKKASDATPKAAVQPVAPPTAAPAPAPQNAQ
jgi:predicted  nucleic acid-binding Zn-ribbon protein